MTANSKVCVSVSVLLWATINEIPQPPNHVNKPTVFMRLSVQYMILISIQALWMVGELLYY